MSLRCLELDESCSGTAPFLSTENKDDSHRLKTTEIRN